MRSEFVSNLHPVLSEVVIKGKDAHHLLKVARIKKGEKILLLDGNGNKYFSTVTNIQKRELTVEVKKIEKCERFTNIDIAIGITKKDYWEKILPHLVELGVNRLHPLTTEYSLNSMIKAERTQNLLITALKQSNNPFMLEVFPKTAFSQFNFSQYDLVLYYCHHPKYLGHPVSAPLKKNEATSDKGVLIVIGAEGGLSPAEEEKLLKIDNIKFIHLEIPILRVPTAVCTALGHYLGVSSI